MERFLHIIVNKQSRNSDTTLKKLIVELPKYTKNFQFSMTENIEQLDRRMCQLKDNILEDDILVIVGGDGSLNQFVSVHQKYGFKNYIGYIPAGSGNDFARTHHIPVDTIQALEHLFNVQAPKEVSIIHATEGQAEHYALNSLGIGIDGLVNYLINTGSTKKVLGSASYLSGVLSGFVKQQKFPVTLKVDEGVFHFENVQLALVANNPYFGGGINIMPTSNGMDEDLEVLIADGVNARDLVIILTKLLTTQNHLSHPKLSTFRSKTVALFTESEQYAQKDGEIIHQEGFAYTFTTKKLKMWI